MISILDCTLRDGGYINHWQFGQNNIKQIISSLNTSNVEIIELGFVKENAISSFDSSLKNKILDFETYLPENCQCEYAIMVNIGEFSHRNFPKATETLIKNIRIAFKKKDIEETINQAKQLILKGYNIFLQPMVTLSYSDEEFISLINKINQIRPYAFYIVDSFGEMTEENLSHYIGLVLNNLNKTTKIGFHSHNNLQLSYSNSIFFLKNIRRDIIIDCSIYGMGRGAGNLNTEIFLDYLNNNKYKKYLISPILNIIDIYFEKLRQNLFWGYSIPFYLSAKNHLHPNYASYLVEKNTLNYFDIETIFKTFDENEKTIFNKVYIKTKYIEYQNRNNNGSIECIKPKIANKDIVLVGPGRSVLGFDFKTISKKLIVICLNQHIPNVDAHYYFYSNKVRYASSIRTDNDVVTSNVEATSKYKIPYFALTNNNDFVFDNALLMCIKACILCGANSIKLVGFDGYSSNSSNDYFDKKLSFGEYFNKSYINVHVASLIKQYSKQIKIKFLTESIYKELFKQI